MSPGVAAPELIAADPGAAVPRRRITVGRLLAVPVPFAAIFALLAAARVPTWPGLAWGGIAGSCLAGVILLGGSPRELLGPIAGFAAGTAIGFPMLCPCTPIGLFVGPVLGLLVASMIRMIVRGRPRTETFATPDDSMERILG